MASRWRSRFKWIQGLNKGEGQPLDTGSCSLYRRVPGFRWRRARRRGRRCLPWSLFACPRATPWPSVRSPDTGNPLDFRSEFLFLSLFPKPFVEDCSTHIIIDWAMRYTSSFLFLIEFKHRTSHVNQHGFYFFFVCPVRNNVKGKVKKLQIPKRDLFCVELQEMMWKCKIFWKFIFRDLRKGTLLTALGA